MKAKLVVVGGNAKATEVNLKLPTIIGRGRDAPLTLALPLVSRQHCEIFEKNGQLVVRDLGSLNGTFINNERITEAVLPNGELLTIGTVTFRAVYDDSAAPKPVVKPVAKVPPKPRPATISDKTVGQPSDPTVDVSPAAMPKPLPKPVKADAPSKSGKGSKVGMPSAKGTPAAAKEAETLKAPAAKGAPPPAGPPPKKKAWAETAAEVEPIDFTDSEDDFELGEDDELDMPAALPPATEFTMQITKPEGFGKRKTKDDDDEFDVQEFDFDAPVAKPALPAAAKKEATVESAAGDLTTNFDPKKLAEFDKARQKAKEQAQASAAKAPAKPPPKAPAVKAPPESSGEQGEAPKKGNLSTDEDLEAFFKSLG